MRYSKRRQDVSQDLSGQIVALPSVSQLSFEKALSAFVEAQDSVGHSKITKGDYKTVVGLFLRYMSSTHGYTSIQEITEADVLSWLAHFRNSSNAYGRPYSSRTIATYCRGVLAFFHWLIDHRYLSFDPTSQIREPKVEKPLIRIFTQDELSKLDAACDRAAQGRSITPDERKMLAARDRAILWLLLSTGIRLSELCGLRFCDIDWDKGMISVMGKGSKERVVPLGSIARQHLNTYIVYWRGTPSDTSERVFITVFGKPVAPSAVKQLFARLKRVAGITDKRVSAHTCRHWFAVNCIKNGMPTVVLKNILGHENWNMIETYVRLAEQDVKQSYVRFSPVDGLDLHSSKKGKRQEARDWRNSRKKSTKD